MSDDDYSFDTNIVNEIEHYIIDDKDDAISSSDKIKVNKAERNNTTTESDCDSNGNYSPLKVHGFASEPPSPDDISDITEEDSDFKLDSLDLIRPLASFKVFHSYQYNHPSLSSSLY